MATCSISSVPIMLVVQDLKGARYGSDYKCYLVRIMVTRKLKGDTS